MKPITRESLEWLRIMIEEYRHHYDPFTDEYPDATMEMLSQVEGIAQTIADNLEIEEALLQERARDESVQDDYPGVPW